MDNIWSKYVQTSEELYYTRELRFNDMNKDLWLKAIGAQNGQNVLEIGCAGGIFCHRIKQYLPDTKVTGLDFDTGHIEFAKAKTKELGLDCTFVNGDATNMPFEDNSFDLCYSHTVVEHIPHEDFLREQYRVLNKGGRITVLYGCSKLAIDDDRCALLEGEEKELVEKAWSKVEGIEIEHSINAYPIKDFHTYPKELEKAGFHDVNVDFFTIVEYAPDNASVSPEFALKQINNLRIDSLSCAQKAINISNGSLTEDEKSKLINLINKRYDNRIKQYYAGEKVWDFTTRTIFAASGIK